MIELGVEEDALPVEYKFANIRQMPAPDVPMHRRLVWAITYA